MWRYHNPVCVNFGVDAFKDLHKLVGDRKYGLVTYADDYFDELSGVLAQRAGRPVVVINDVQPNPDYDLLDQQVQRIGACEAPEVWVALGGGSVIDSAKVFAAANGDFGNVARYLETGEGAHKLSATPIIAAPTTAGTGSEVTCWATVWNERAGKKFSLARPDLYPEVAVIDPALMCGKPLDLTISTGLDALSHALESIWNVNANPVSANHAVFAASEVLETLPLLVKDLQNVELRARMAQASMMAGLAFSNTKTAIAHSVSYPITLNHDVPHGIACSFSLPIVIESVKSIGGLCGASLGRVFDGDVGGAPDRLAEFLSEFGVSVRPADHGVTDEEWSGLVEAAFAGERGRNFIGNRPEFLNAATRFGAAVVT